MRYIIAVSFLILFVLSGFAQEKKQDQDKVAEAKNDKSTENLDPYRLDYKDVYNNMHYNQPLRPQVHYTPLTGQIADPTGLVRYKGTYHMFYMFDEWSKQRRDNKNWGHAISNDCIYWSQESPITNSIIDNRPGSGSGIIDWNNTLGLRKAVEKTMVVFYTDYGRGISMLFSSDAGKTWIRHKRNPLIPARKGLRDPNVFWYKPDQSWRMVVYDTPGITFYKSANLLDWQLLSKMDNFFECPDLIQIPVDGKENYKKWVLIDGNGSYYIGEFNGTTFVPQSKKIPLGEESFLNNDGEHKNMYTKDIYATQSWKQSYEGDGPFYQMAFMMINEPPTHNRVWSQQMIFPVELTLKTINNEIRLCRTPIDGIKQLRYDPTFWDNKTVKPHENALEKIHGDVFEIIANINLGSAKDIVFNIRGEKAIYHVNERVLSFMNSESKIIPVENKIKLRFIVDRNSVEIYANQGETTVTRLFYPNPENLNLSLTAEGGEFIIDRMETYKLESIWLKKEQELGYQRDAGNK